MYIDIDRLRADLVEDSYGAFYGGGFGGALMEAFDIHSASDMEIINIAKSKGINLEEYCYE